MDEFFKSIDALVAMNDYNQRENEQLREVMSPGQWAIEMATVHVSVGRRVGKTSYIKSRARCADLVITHNEDFKKHEYQGSRATVVSISNLQHYLRDGWRGLPPVGFNIVYVDEPVLVFRNWDIFEFYAAFGGQHCRQVCANMFVMLGTGVLATSRH